MAGKIQNTSQSINHSFTKGLNKDSDPSFVQDGMWTHARNASNNTVEGDLGAISNEASNFLCATTGATMPTYVIEKYIIGAIQLFSDKWLVYTAGHDAQGKSRMSEIGLLEEDSCRYRPIVQDACLGFDKRYLISGTSRKKEDCSWQAYWVDGYNPDRFLNVGDPQTWPGPDYVWLGTLADMNYYSNGTNKILWPGVRWTQTCTTVSSCTTCVNNPYLDCNHIRLARLMETPCLKLTPASSGGTLRNGTYYATIAYSIKGQKVTDYFSASNTQPLWTVNDAESALSIEVEADHKNFDEFILVVVQNINQGTVARQIGTYSTKTTRIQLDQIKEDLISVPVSQLPILTPVFEKSNQMAEVNNYLLRVGPTSKFDFNYQPLANLINAKWTSVQYPGNYYVKGGGKGSYLRDEVYTFFIRWVYDTGDKSASYHIPGRAPRNFLVPTTATSTPEQALLPTDQNALAPDDQVFEVYNTASSTPAAGLVGTTLPDGGLILDTGDMAYWESTETYPDTQDYIWNASAHCWTGKQNMPSPLYDLCGVPIRHHKFPDNCLNANTVHFSGNTNPTTQGDDARIRLMGVYFENIIAPKDNDGNDIPGIVGYEILRGSRELNKSIIAKGMINNVRTYTMKGNVARGKTGIYANYPFNTTIPLGSSTNPSDHNYQYNDPYIKSTDTNGDIVNQTIPKDIVTFHSPDTMFTSPFLSVTELKLYGYLTGNANQNFQDPNQHPQFKLLSDATVIVMFIGGLIEALVSLTGRRTYDTPKIPDFYQQILGVTPGATINDPAQTAAQTAIAGTVATANTTVNTYYTTGGYLLDALGMQVGGYSTTGQAVFNDAVRVANNTAAVTPLTGAIALPALTGSQELPGYAFLPVGLRTIAGLQSAIFYFSEGADVTLNLIYTLLPYRQYAMQMVAYGFYNNMTPENLATDIFRFKSAESFYIRDNIQEVPKYQDSSGVYHSYNLNNLKRSDTVTVRTTTGAGITDGPKLLNIDKSLVTLGTLLQNQTNPVVLPGVLPEFDNISVPFSLPIASHYGGLKVRLRNQYGQLLSIKQIPITPCEQKIGSTGNNFVDVNTGIVCPDITTTIGSVLIQKTLQRTSILFGGDTFINRYTEKNSMFFFYDWLYGQPDGFEYNYYLHQMIPSPRFAVNSIKYDPSDLAPSNWNNPLPGTGAFPRRFYQLDWWEGSGSGDHYNYTNDVEGNYPGLFGVKRSKFYLANSSVKDFFVESDVLVDFRTQGIYEGEKHYDPYRYTDYVAMFNMNPDIITRGNQYRYDYSLSISKAYTQYFSQGNLQSRYYDPKIASLCFTYLPNRIYYSLPQQNESFKDSWFIFLPNNYNEFKSQISGVKSINKSGIFITFKNDSPLMYQGVDTLQTGLGTKITIGDGGLFSQPGQSVSNADKPYEYGSSQNKLGVISTPAGLFYMSENQAKIFNYAGGLKEISQVGLKWWFTIFLPYVLTEDFPDYPWQDNPVAGIGCQALYDNTNSIIYFSKKDYKLKKELKDKVGYVSFVTSGKNKGTGDYFTLNGTGRYLIGDPRLFDDASWTLSYDPKNNFWISYHDWHPDFNLPTKTTFLTTKKNTIWKHNIACDHYCNYYGEDHPFEVEIPVITGESVTTVKSVQYALECYKRNGDNCVDQFQVLDFNFDKAVVFNSEQVSGYLNLNIFPKNNITLSLEYPKPNPAIIIEPNVPPLPGFEILFSKEEQKYRFNQFWDITKDRGEFPVGDGYPPQGPLIPGTTQLLGNYTQEYLWTTQPNGYIKTLNPNNMDINKPLLQRKKFRHYLNFLHLRRDISGNVNMILKLTSTKNQLSNR